MKNREAPWDRFDAAAYEAHNYGDVRPEDALIAQRFLEIAVEMQPATVVDVGTGTNLMPLLVALAATDAPIDVWEFSRSNVEWLRHFLERPVLPVHWAKVWWQLGGLTQADSERVMTWLRHRVRIYQASVFHLPPRTWDHATMAFCAESITDDPRECALAVQRFLEAIRPNGSFAAAFMVNSGGYTVGDVTYPAVALSLEDVASLFEACAAVAVTSIPIVQAVRPGYTGMAVVEGRV